MPSLRIALTAALLTAALSVSAYAQMPWQGDTTTGTTQTRPSSSSSTVDEVKTWTRKQYNAARAEWMKDERRWAGCRARARTQKLHGRANWSFLYTCMKR